MSMFLELLQKFQPYFHSWTGAYQFLFVIIIASLGTLVAVKLTDIFNNIVSTIPILIHGWPKTARADVQKDDDGDDSTPPPTSTPPPNDNDIKIA